MLSITLPKMLGYRNAYKQTPDFQRCGRDENKHKTLRNTQITHTYTHTYIYNEFFSASITYIYSQNTGSDEL